MISHTSRCPPDVILRRSFVRPSTTLAVIEGLGMRLTDCSLLVIYMVSRSHVVLMKILRLKCLQLPVLKLNVEQVSTFPSTFPPIKTAKRWTDYSVPRIQDWEQDQELVLWKRTSCLCVCPSAFLLATKCSFIRSHIGLGIRLATTYRYCTMLP